MEIHSTDFPGCRIMQKIIPLVPAVLAKAIEGQPIAREADQERAWDLFENATFAKTPAEARNLLEQALELDPNNIGIMEELLEVLGLIPEAEIKVLRKMILLAETLLGKKVIKQAKGELWYVGEARPYMRLRDRYAHKLLECGQLMDACREWHALIELNRNDNLGVRYHMLCGLLAMGMLKQVKAMYKLFDEADLHTVFAWGKVLMHLIEDDEARAVEALDRARKQNPYTEKFIVGKGKYPKRPLDSYMPGDISEAQMYAIPLEFAWSKHPKAMGWLLMRITRKNNG